MEKNHGIMELFDLFFCAPKSEHKMSAPKKKKNQNQKSKEVIHISHIHTVAEYRICNGLKTHQHIRASTAEKLKAYTFEMLE